MPYALVIVGLLMIITGINNTYAQFAGQLQKDSAGFIYYFIALFAVGALGYIDDLKQFSHYFMALILVSLVLSNKGVFSQFQAAIKAGPTAPTASATTGSSSSSQTVIPQVQSAGAQATPAPVPSAPKLDANSSMSDRLNLFFNNFLTSPAN